MAKHRRLFQSFIYRRSDMKLYNSYTDVWMEQQKSDWTEFKRVLEDGRVNCVVVEDLFSFGRMILKLDVYTEKLSRLQRKV